jgi:hypothetical protein
VGFAGVEESDRSGHTDGHRDRDDRRGGVAGQPSDAGQGKPGSRAGASQRPCHGRGSGHQDRAEQRDRHHARHQQWQRHGRFGAAAALVQREDAEQRDACLCCQPEEYADRVRPGPVGLCLADGPCRAGPRPLVPVGSQLSFSEALLLA